MPVPFARRLAVPLLIGVAVAAAPAAAVAAPVVTVSKVADLDPTSETLTVTGTGFANTAPGIYVGPTTLVAGETKPSNFDMDGTKWIDSLPNGEFSTTVTVRAAWADSSTSVECFTDTCGIGTVKAHGTPDRSQDTFTPLTFKARPTTPPAGEPAPTPTPDPGPAPGSGTPVAPVTPVQPPPAAAVTKPALSKAVLTAKRFSVRVSEPGTVRATVKQRSVKRVRAKGKVRRVVQWRTVRSLKATTKAAGTVRFRPRLGAGRFRVTFQVTSAAGVKGTPVTRSLAVK